METEPILIFERKKTEIVLGINSLIQSGLHRDPHQSEDLSDLTSEISRVSQLDNLLSQKCSINIWNALENINLGSKYAYLYLGLVADYDNELKANFFGFIKPCLEGLEGNYNFLITLIKKCSINDLLKLITIFNFAVKENKDKLDQNQKNEIITSLQARFKNIFASNNNYDFSIDLLIRRFLQFLEWKIDDVLKLNINFWISLLDYHITLKTFDYIFPVLDIHLNEYTNAQSRNLIFRILSREKQTGILINQEFFWKQKERTLWYMQFYLDDIYINKPKNSNLNNIEKLGASSAISLFLSYMRYKNRKHMHYLIDNSELIRIFDYKLSENIENLLSKVVDLQLTSRCPSKQFLERYFSFIKAKPNPYEVSRAQSIANQLILLSFLKIDDNIKIDISEYTINFFKNYYEFGIINYEIDGNTVQKIILLFFQNLPTIWDKISQAANEINQKFGDSDTDMQYDRQEFWNRIIRKRKSQLNIFTPEPFNKFIDSLICYLYTGSQESWNEMSDIVSDWNDGFNINSADYKSNDFWAKVLIYFCWRSNNLNSLKDFWENKSNELKIKEETKISEKSLTEAQNIEKKLFVQQENDIAISIKDSKEDFPLLSPIVSLEAHDVLQPSNKEIVPDEHKGHEEKKEIEAANPPIVQHSKIWTEDDIRIHAGLTITFLFCFDKN